eukprot:gene32711-3595_t
MAGQPGKSAFSEKYLEALEKVSVDRHEITFLRDIAEDNKDTEAVNLVAAIQTFLYKCPTQKHLAVLYLIDCILKTVKDPNPYPYVFGLNMPALFAFVWDKHSPSTGSNIRPKLEKMAKTWRDVGFDHNTLLLVDNKVQGRVPTPPPAAPQPAPPMIQPVPQPVYNPLPPVGMPQPIPLIQTADIDMGPGPQMAWLPHPGAVAGMVHANHASPQQHLPPRSPPGPSVGALMHQMMDLGNRLGAAAPPAAATSETGPSGSTSVSIKATEFSSQAIKDYSQEAVNNLMEASNATRGKFLDLKFLRNRRLKAATAALSRHWFLPIDSWLQGSTVEPEAEHKHFEEEHAEDDDQDLPLVEEDPSQPACVISGELFERSYDPGTDTWYYEDAVVLSGEEAEKYGVMDGTIVKIHALAGAPSSVELAAKGLGNTAASTAAILRGSGLSHSEDKKIENDMREAAAVADAESTIRNVVPNGGITLSGEKRALEDIECSANDPELKSDHADPGISQENGVRDEKRLKTE